ncbi:peptidylprolyl isomerase SurA [Parashewanella spongiae]|uniref:Chaperone SurA n=1 Tax=Parashewanella spongiae TaxID=342950 RepID=A0A3A6U967_9GAMM|nr:peptidylprolyl isomerase SurA [Parashewanella spongiae]MCL1076673.1 peptidylprolyl isomerase SurA [Parashewanella spongiae]RJY18481.1 peptidylprolyl isomerase SurA [Parashewanella spongiae]
MRLCKQLICAIFTLVLSQQVTAIPQPLDKVAVQVDDGIILESEIQDLISSVKSNAVTNKQELPSDNALRTQVVERLILTHLQLQMAARIGLHIGDLQLDQTIENIAKEQNLSIEEMKQQIEGSDGSFSQYREQVRKDMTIGEIQRIQVQRRIQVSPQEINNLVKLIQEQGNKNVEYQIGHILIEVPSNPSGEQLEASSKRAKAVLKRLNDGTDFKRTAIAASSGPKALEGGIWNYMNINEMPTLFAEVVNGTHTDDILGPIKSGSGFHIIKVIDVRGQQIQEIKEVRARHILLKPSPILSNERAQKLLSQLLEQIRSGKAKFEDLARKYSEDPGSATKGGELGWAQPNVYVPAFAKTLNELDIEQISEPFRTSHGWHIAQLEERRTVDATDKNNTNRAHQLIYRRKFNEELQKWFDEMRADAFIDVLNQ